MDWMVKAPHPKRLNQGVAVMLAATALRVAIVVLLDEPVAFNLGSLILMSGVGIFVYLTQQKPSSLMMRILVVLLACAAANAWSWLYTVISWEAEKTFRLKDGTVRPILRDGQYYFQLLLLWVSALSSVAAVFHALMLVLSQRAKSHESLELTVLAPVREKSPVKPRHRADSLEASPLTREV